MQIRRAEGGIEKEGLQVDRSHKQHLYEIYCLQVQMVQRQGGGEEGGGGVGTVQVNCIFTV